MKHFLGSTDLQLHEIKEVFSLAADFKRLRNRHTPPVLDKQTWGLLFFKNSTRTRVSFEIGVRELGGTSLYLDDRTMQVGRGESIKDTANVLSRYMHGLIIRTFEHEIIEEFAKHSSIPVINALTDLLHPCQTFTDIFTLLERWSDPQSDSWMDDLKGKKIAFFGDTACNMANSWVILSKLLGFQLVLSGPEGFETTQEAIQFMKSRTLDTEIHFTTDAKEAADQADMLYTDVWVSMGKEKESEERIELMKPYSVTEELFSLAKPDAYFMHCMPTHPGWEVSETVLENPRAILYDQAENRLHTQKAIMAILAEAKRSIR